MKDACIEMYTVKPFDFSAGFLNLAIWHPYFGQNLSIVACLCYE